MKVRIAALVAAMSLLLAPAISYSAASAAHVAGTTNLTSVLTKAAAAYTDADVDVKGKDVIGIYSGKIRNWKQLGGEDRPIVLFGRPIGTGMRFVFEQNVAKTLVDITAPKSAPQTLATIASTPGAIGYMGMSFIGTHTDMMISYNGVPATRENIANHSYVFATDEHLYVRKNASPQAKAFVAFVAQHKDLLSESGIY